MITFIILVYQTLWLYHLLGTCTNFETIY